MSGIRVGAHAITIRAPATASHLRHFVARITDTASAEATHVLDILPGHRPQLRINGARRHAVLQLPDDVATRLGQQRVEIGVLQAVTRALAAMGAADGLALLHGSATTMDRGRSAVAVLDGGAGQGKTSLAVALARAGGHLLVDEFTFAVVDNSALRVVPLPQLPWHIRQDMTAVLVPEHDGRSLLYGADLPGLCWAGTQPVPLSTVLIPDQQLPAGRVDRLDTATARRMLHTAVTDHTAKLHDPGRDHVSIFASAADVTTDTGDATPTIGVLEHLLAVPAWRVGIGDPDDLENTVSAVLAAIAGAR